MAKMTDEQFEAYRQYAKTPEGRALLNVLSAGEGGDYNTTVYGGTFNDYSQHPNMMKTANLRHNDGSVKSTTSSAAGAYQFLNKTFKGIQDQSGGRIKDFSPENQDVAALILMDNTGGLNEWKKGNYKQALTKAGGQWASIPTDKYGVSSHGWGDYGDYLRTQPGIDQSKLGDFVGYGKSGKARPMTLYRSDGTGNTATATAQTNTAGAKTPAAAATTPVQGGTTPKAVPGGKPDDILTKMRDSIFGGNQKSMDDWIKEIKGESQQTAAPKQPATILGGDPNATSIIDSLADPKNNPAQTVLNTTGQPNTQQQTLDLSKSPLDNLLGYLQAGQGNQTQPTDPKMSMFSLMSGGDNPDVLSTMQNGMTANLSELDNDLKLIENNKQNDDKLSTLFGTGRRGYIPENVSEYIDKIIETSIV